MSAAAAGSSNQTFDQDSMQQDERSRSRAGTATAGLAGFGNLSNSINDVMNGMDSGVASDSFDNNTFNLIIIK